jgi:pheromone shutdown protein TraB
MRLVEVLVLGHATRMLQSQLSNHLKQLGLQMIAPELTSGRIRHGAEMSPNLRVSKAFKQARVFVTFSGWGFHIRVRQWSYNVAKMMGELGAYEVAELYKTANILCVVGIGHYATALTFLFKTEILPSKHCVAQVLHLLKTEKAFFLTTQLRLFKPSYLKG